MQPNGQNLPIRSPESFHFFIGVHKGKLLFHYKMNGPSEIWKNLIAVCDANHLTIKTRHNTTIEFDSLGDNSLRLTTDIYSTSGGSHELPVKFHVAKKNAIFARGDQEDIKWERESLKYLGIILEAP